MLKSLRDEDHKDAEGAMTARDPAFAKTQPDTSFCLTGQVVRGFGRGKELGFPTANVRVPESQALPRSGIYAAWADVDGRRFMAATSVGVNPTFEERRHAIEAHLLGFHENLYGKSIRLTFVQRLRDEAAFDGVPALVEQIERDVEQTRAILSA